MIDIYIKYQIYYKIYYSKKLYRGHAVAADNYHSLLMIRLLLLQPVKTLNKNRHKYYMLRSWQHGL